MSTETPTPPARLPWPLLVFLVAALAGGVLETLHVWRREETAIAQVRGQRPADIDREWALRGLSPKDRAEVESLLDARSSGEQKDFYWLYPARSGDPESMVKRYLAASLLYPRLLYRRTVTACELPGERPPAAGLVDECNG